MYNSHKYAKSLLDVSVKTNTVLTVKKELQLVAYLFKKTPTFRLIFITKNKHLIVFKHVIHHFSYNIFWRSTNSIIITFITN